MVGDAEMGGADKSEDKVELEAGVAAALGC